MNEINRFAVLYRILCGTRTTKKQLINLCNIPGEEISRHVAKFNRQQDKYCIQFDNDGYYCIPKFIKNDIEIISNDFISSIYISKIIFLLFSHISDIKKIDSYLDFISIKVLNTKLKNMKFRKISELKKCSNSEIKYIISQIAVTQIIPDKLDSNYIYSDCKVWQLEKNEEFCKFKKSAHYFTKKCFENYGLINVSSTMYFTMFFYILQECILTKSHISSAIKSNFINIFETKFLVPDFLDSKIIKTFLFFDCELFPKQINLKKISDFKYLKELTEKRIKFYNDNNMVVIEEYYNHHGSSSLTVSAFSLYDFLFKENKNKISQDIFNRIVYPILNLWIQNLKHIPAFISTKKKYKNSEYEYKGQAPLYNLYIKKSKKLELSIYVNNGDIYVESPENQNQEELNKVLLFHNLRICSYVSREIIILVGNAPSVYHTTQFVLTRNYPNINFHFISDVYYFENRDMFKNKNVYSIAINSAVKMITCRSVDNNYPNLFST